MLRSSAVALISVMATGAGAFVAGSETIRNCRGEAYVKGELTDEAAKSSALGMARAEAVKKAFGLSVRDQFIDVTIQRANDGSDLAIREMQAVAHGLVVGEENLRWTTDLVRTGPNQTAITRHAVVGDFVVAKPPESGRTFWIKLKLNKATVVAGDPIRLELSGSETSYATVFNLAADNRVYLLVPNRFRPEVKLAKGESLQIPGAKDAKASI